MWYRMTKVKDKWRIEKAKKQLRNTRGQFVRKEDYGEQRTIGYCVSTSPIRKGELSKNCIEYFKRMMRLRRLNRKSE